MVSYSPEKPSPINNTIELELTTNYPPKNCYAVIPGYDEKIELGCRVEPFIDIAEVLYNPVSKCKVKIPASKPDGSPIETLTIHCEDWKGKEGPKKTISIE